MLIFIHLFRQLYPVFLPSGDRVWFTLAFSLPPFYPHSDNPVRQITLRVQGHLMYFHSRLNLNLGLLQPIPTLYPLHLNDSQSSKRKKPEPPKCLASSPTLSTVSHHLLHALSFGRRRYLLHNRWSPI